MTSNDVKKIIDAARTIVIIQADNPDGDSLASALALESILEGQGKKTVLYCGVEIPSYLRYMNGWDRVTNELPQVFDASIIVDTSAISLLESLVKNRTIQWLKSKPSIILDHHITTPTIDFASVIYQKEAASTGILIHGLCKDFNWELTLPEAELIVYSILSDTLGLTSETVGADTLTVVTELVTEGVSLAKLDSTRRSLSKKSAELVAYKGRLLQRIQYEPDDRIAILTIPFDEIQMYSHAYNPSMLVIDEMRSTSGVDVAIAFKTYPDGKITAKIRSNYGIKIANAIAEEFGGGGHVYAAGFKITDGRSLAEIQSETIRIASHMLDKIKKESSDEVIQYSF